MRSSRRRAWYGSSAALRPMGSRTSRPFVRAQGPIQAHSVIRLGKRVHASGRGAGGPKVDAKTPPVEQVAKMDSAAFFGRLAALLKDNPPTAADKPMVEKLARLGIVPGQPFDATKIGPAMAKGIERGATSGREQILAEARKPQGKMVNGWDVMGDLGRYGTNYLFRAVVALVGLGANLPEDAVYPHAKVDADGKPLTGANRYTIHFLRASSRRSRRSGRSPCTTPNNSSWTTHSTATRSATGTS